MLKLEQQLVSTLNHNERLHSETYDYQSIFLSSVQPDENNGRFLPAILIEDEHAKQFTARKLSKKQLIDIYQGKEHVLIGKSCIVNCFKYDSHDWKKANQTIESIIELGENILVSEVIQVPTIYPLNNGKYQILTGHRRFFALVYANGYDSAAQFKVYSNKPLLTKVKQFQENSSREDLPQYGKLQAFLNALGEIDTLNSARLKVGKKKYAVKEVAANLGISMGAFDNYNVLTRYPSVIKAYETGLSLPFVKVKKVVLNVESEYKVKHGKTIFNISDKRNISELIMDILKNEKKSVIVSKIEKTKNIKSLSTVKTTLSSNIKDLDTGIDWNSLDWEDQKSVTEALDSVILHLNSLFLKNE